jgi:hypothetical protein
MNPKAEAELDCAHYNTTDSAKQRVIIGHYAVI